MMKAQFEKDKHTLLKTIAHYDSNSSGEEISEATKNRRNVKPHTLLVQVLLEYICNNIEKDEERKNSLFNEIYQRLRHVHFVDPSLDLEGLKLQRQGLAKNFNQFLTMMLKEPAMQPSISRGLLPKRDPDTPSLYLQNRYNETFEELAIIAKGGFGVVCKVKHKVDDNVYAVKKVKFKYKNDQEFQKVIKEAKAIATLKHKNIVRYNNAWIDLHMSPQDSSSESSSKTSSQDAQFQNESSSSSSNEKSSDSSKRFNTVLKTGLLKYEGKYANNSINSFEGESESQSSLKDKSNELQLNKTSPSTTSSISIGDFNMRNANAPPNREQCYRLKTWLNEDSPTEVQSNDLNKEQKPVLLSSSDESNKDCVSETLEKDIKIEGDFVDWDNILHPSRALQKSEVVKKICKSSDFFESGILRNLPNLQWEPTLLHMKVALCIQMEYCDCDLHFWLDARAKGEKLPFEMDVIEIFKQILSGVEHIHLKSIIHRDLKPKNIFFSKETGVIKIGDFGLAALVNCTSDDGMGNEGSVSLSAGMGSLPYAAPEQRSKKNYGCKVDIYSLGIILFELLQKFRTLMEFSKAVEELLVGSFNVETQMKRLEFFELVKKLIKINPKERPSAREILQLPLMRHNKMEEITTSEITRAHELTISQKEAEILLLKNALVEKDILIEELKRQLSAKNHELEKLKSLNL